MGRASYNYSTSSLRVCIDALKDGRISGRVLGRRLSTPILFSDINELIVKIDDVFDAQDFPQSFQRRRRFAETPEIVSPHAGVDGELLDEAVVNNEAGIVSTFVLLILARQYSTWQGRVDWLDGGPEISFESELQLIDLIDKFVIKKEKYGEDFR